MSKRKMLFMQYIYYIYNFLSNNIFDKRQNRIHSKTFWAIDEKENHAINLQVCNKSLFMTGQNDFFPASLYFLKVTKIAQNSEQNFFCHRWERENAGGKKHFLFLSPQKKQFQWSLSSSSSYFTFCMEDHFTW